ncbi:MAG: hypothetical protein GXP54_06430 [Deltaproteobacteria bacterium]|nr:hypothetical protein [Deltaproteobacteria bacterium]
MRLTHAAMLILLVLAASTAGCQKVKTKLGIGDDITRPAPGTPEKVIQDVLKAAINADEEAGWEGFYPLLHTDEADSPAAMNNWRTIKFPAIRRKAAYLLTDKSSFEFTVMDRREDGRSLTIFVKNSKSDSPTPCKLRQDPDKGNAWMVFNSCF